MRSSLLPGGSTRTSAVPSRSDPGSLRHALVLRDDNARSRCSDIINGDQSAVVHSVMIRAQHRHVLRAVSSAGFPADDVGYVARGFAPAAQRAAVVEQVPSQRAGCMGAGVNATARASAGHELGVSSSPAGGVAVHVVGISGTPNRDAHAGDTDSEFPGECSLGLTGCVPSPTFFDDRIGQFLGGPAVLARRPSLRRQVLDGLTAGSAGFDLSGEFAPGRDALLIGELARIAAELGPRCLTRENGKGLTAFLALDLDHEFSIREGKESFDMAEISSKALNSGSHLVEEVF